MLFVPSRVFAKIFAMRKCEISHCEIRIAKFALRKRNALRNFAFFACEISQFRIAKFSKISHCEISQNFAKFYNHVAYQMKALERCYKNMTKKLVFDLRGHRGDLKWPQKVNITQGGTATVLNFDTRNAIFFKWSNIVYMYVSLSQLQSNNFLFSKLRLEGGWF